MVGGGGAAGLHSGRRDESGLPSIRVEQIDERKGNVGCVLAQRPGGNFAGPFGGLCLDFHPAQVAKGPQPPLADHPAGGFVAGAENAADGPVIVANRAVGEGEVDSSRGTLRCMTSSRSSDQVASPVANTPSSIGPMIDQISLQHSRPDRPSQPGCLVTPSIGT